MNDELVFAHVGFGAAPVHGALQIPARQVGDRLGAEADVRKDQLTVHPASLRRAPRARPAAGGPVSKEVQHTRGGHSGIFKRRDL